MLHYTNTEDPSYRLAFQTAHERQCPMLCHTEGGPSAAFFKSILADYPDCQFLYAHLGGCSIPMMETMIEVAQERPNFFYDLGVSNMPRGALKWLTENCPVDQILYSSDHPLNDFTFQLGRVLYADIDDSVRKKILWDNAARIFKIK
jgi:predicted TIM-barrel fold metal-dependent hydrolase